MILQSSRMLVFAPLARACAGSDKLFVEAVSSHTKKNQPPVKEIAGCVAVDEAVDESG